MVLGEGGFAGRYNASMGRCFIGTSGWVYKHWRGLFYPKTLPAHAWLPFYAERFGTVELNNSFYRLPRKAGFAAWRRTVPAGFVFSVKASRYLTHLKRLKQPSDPLRRFLTRAAALQATLGPVLFQLPGQFHVDIPRLRRFLGVLGRQRYVPGLRAVLEVRHESWLVPEVFDLLERANVALCLQDWRDAPVREPVTADFVYIRRHGTTHRYGGSYTDPMLRSDAREIGAWLSEGRDVYVYFNNDDNAYAIGSAQRLAHLLQRRESKAA